MYWMENSFAPKMDKINRNVWVLTLKDSILQVLPMILIGSLVTMVNIIRNYIPAMPTLSPISGYTMGLISLFIAFLIPFNYMEKAKLSKIRLVSGMAGVCVFAVVIRMRNLPELDFSYFGAGGMFVAIAIGVYVALIMSFFGKFSFFKKDSSIPDFVRNWFDSMLPVGLCVIIAWVFVYLLNFDMYNALVAVFDPINAFAQSFGGFVLICFLWVFLYSMGISTWVLTPLTRPVRLAGIAANAAAVAAGMSATNIMISEVTHSGWIAVGGMGATLPLVIMMCFSKCKRIKALGLASMTPSIFNINEPVVFGVIAWNPIMMIPMWLQGIIIPSIVYPALRFGFAPIPHEVFDLWYAPFPISTWIVSQSVNGLILLAIVVAAATLIWFPFYKVYERQQIAMENKQAQASALANA